MKMEIFVILRSILWLQLIDYKFYLSDMHLLYFSILKLIYLLLSHKNISLNVNRLHGNVLTITCQRNVCVEKQSAKFS